jgi:hypothetical protein
LLRGVREYARRILDAEAVEGGFTFDPVTGLPNGLTGRITLREPTAAEGAKGLVSVDSLFQQGDAALAADEHVAAAPGEAAVGAEDLG